MDPKTGKHARLISIVSKPIKLICGQTNFDEKIVKKLGQKKNFVNKSIDIKKFGTKNFLGPKNFFSKKKLGRIKPAWPPPPPRK